MELWKYSKLLKGKSHFLLISILDIIIGSIPRKIPLGEFYTFLFELGIFFINKQLVLGRRVWCLVFCDVHCSTCSKFGFGPKCDVWKCSKFGPVVMCPDSSWNIQFDVRELFSFWWCSTCLKFNFGLKCDVQKVQCSECSKFGIFGVRSKTNTYVHNIGIY